MDAYDREKAAAYALRWALDRNPKFYDYENLGGDCTNFISQVLLNGGAPMDYKETFGWYYLTANRKVSILDRSRTVVPVPDAAKKHLGFSPYLPQEKASRSAI